VAPPSIFNAYSASKAWEDGWGDPAPPEPPPLPISEHDAIAVESALLTLPSRTMRLLRNHFAFAAYYPREEIDASCRLLQDAIEERPSWE